MFVALYCSTLAKNVSRDAVCFADVNEPGSFAPPETFASNYKVSRPAVEKVSIQVNQFLVQG